MKKIIYILYCFYSEESKPDSDLDEPWIMTVKGLNFNNFSKQGAAIMAGDESLLSTGAYKHNGSNNSPSNRDSNLNHYKSNQVIQRNSTEFNVPFDEYSIIPILFLSKTIVKAFLNDRSHHYNNYSNITCDINRS